jgi:hypothetical protein
MEATTNNQGDNKMNTTTKRTRRSHCVFCARTLKEVAVITASDSDQFIGAFLCEDDELVWIDKESRSMCDASHDGTSHTTPADYRTWLGA